MLQGLLEITGTGTSGLRPHSGESWGHNQLPEADQPTPQTVTSEKEATDQGKRCGKKKRRKMGRRGGVEGTKTKSLLWALQPGSAAAEAGARPEETQGCRACESQEGVCPGTAGRTPGTLGIPLPQTGVQAEAQQASGARPLCPWAQGGQCAPRVESSAGLRARHPPSDWLPLACLTIPPQLSAVGQSPTADAASETTNAH